MGSAFAFAVMTAIAFATAFPTLAVDSGRIYVYAQRETAARPSLPITSSGLVIAELKRGTFFGINLPPGRHTVGVETGVPIFVELHSGEEAFVRLDWNYHVGRPPIPVLSVVHSDRAHKEMMYLSYISAKKCFSGLVPKTDPRKPTLLELKRRPGQ